MSSSTKRLSTHAALIIFCSLDSMHQFDYGDNGQTHLDLTVRRLKLFKDLPDSVATALSGNDDTGVEYQSQEEGVHG